MRRQLLKAAAFRRAAKRLLKQNPQTAHDLHATPELLTEDAFHPALKTHQLKGALAECWACSAGDELRSVFEFV